MFVEVKREGCQGTCTLCSTPHWQLQAERDKAVEALGDYGTSVHAYMMEIARLEAENKKLKEKP